MDVVQKYKLSYVKEDNNALPDGVIKTKNDVCKTAQQLIGDSPLESVLIFALNTANTIIGYTAMDGDVNQCAVYPKTVFRFLLSTAAASFVMVHNHPGGSLEPNDDDWSIALRLKRIGRDLQLDMLDSVIITDGGCWLSMQDHPRWDGATG